MVVDKKNQMFPLLLLLISTFFGTFSFSSTDLNIIYTSTMENISDNKHGSYSKLATLLKKERKENPNTIFLFGGDSLAPSAMSSLDKGVHIIDILNSLEPDAVAVNKRELTFFPDELTLRSFEAAFPFIASNIYDSFPKDNIDGVYKSFVIKKSNLKIGILSVLAPSVIEEYGLKRISILDIEDSIRAQAKYLRKHNVDYIILLPSNVFKLTQKLLDEGVIDLSLDTHHHLDLKKQEQSKDKRNIILIQKGDILKKSISFDTKTHKVLNTNSELLQLNNYQEDEKVLKKINYYKNKIELLFKEKIGIFESKVNTERSVVRKKESVFGNLIADVMKEYTNSDIALINGGNIRGEAIYNKNHKISRKDIINELPFRNNLVLLEVNGDQILKALENGLSLIEKAKGRFPHTTGMKIKFNKNAPVGKRVISVFIKGKKLDKKQMYTLATLDYIASGGDGYDMFIHAKPVEYSNSKQRLLSNVLIDYIIKNKSINTKLEGRIEEINHEN